MRSSKIIRKVLAGILCAAMVFQCVPAQTSEAAQIAQSYDSGETNTLEEEGYKEESTILGTLESEEVPEMLESVVETDMVEIPSTAEESNALETLLTTEESDEIGRASCRERVFGLV